MLVGRFLASSWRFCSVRREFMRRKAPHPSNMLKSISSDRFSAFRGGFVISTLHEYLSHQTRSSQAWRCSRQSAHKLLATRPNSPDDDDDTTTPPPPTTPRQYHRPPPPPPT